MSTRGSHVRIEAIGHRYGLRRAWVLDDISLTIEPASRVALVGRSGCGKSTLLQLISGLVSPTRGRVMIDGAAVRSPSPRWNMMFQKPSLYPWMTAGKNAALGMLIAGESRQAKVRIPELLDLVGMADFAKSRVRQLSGGQQQRISLARSLATQPELLMLDEPFAALDESTRAAMQQDVIRITKQLGITLIIVTHDIDEAFLMADQVVVMTPNPGRIATEISAKQRQEMGEATAKEQVRTILEVEQPGSSPNQLNHAYTDVADTKEKCDGNVLVNPQSAEEPSLKISTQA